MKTKSDVLAQLNYDKSSFDLEDWMTAQETLSSGVYYHIIVGGNKQTKAGFSSATNGRTRNIRKLENGKLSYYYWTRIGDNLVPVTLSKFINIKVDYFEMREHSSIP